MCISITLSRKRFENYYPKTLHECSKYVCTRILFSVRRLKCRTNRTAVRAGSSWFSRRRRRSRGRTRNRRPTADPPPTSSRPSRRTTWTRSWPNTRRPSTCYKVRWRIGSIACSRIYVSAASESYNFFFFVFFVFHLADSLSCNAFQTARERWRRILLLPEIFIPSLPVKLPHRGEIRIY